MFLVGLLVGCFVLFPLGVFLFVKLGFLSLATTAKPLPGEAFLAQTALAASIGSAQDRSDPLAASDENLLAGAREYREHCAVCHGLPGQPKTQIAAGMFPKAPQLFEGHGVTDDSEGETFWKVSNGIRLSGMPGFPNLPEQERWQVTTMLKHADKLPPRVETELRQPAEPSR